MSTSIPHTGWITGPRQRNHLTPKERKFHACQRKPLPLKIYQVFFVIFFFKFLNWGFIEEISSLWLFLRETMNPPFERNRWQGADYVGLKEPSSLFKDCHRYSCLEHTSAHQCAWNPRLHRALSLRVILINGVLIARDSVPPVGLMLSFLTFQKACLFFIFINIYWSTVDLQHRVSFRYTAQWISLVYLYTFIPSFPDSFPI